MEPMRADQNQYSFCDLWSCCRGRPTEARAFSHRTKPLHLVQESEKLEDPEKVEQ